MNRQEKLTYWFYAAVFLIMASVSLLRLIQGIHGDYFLYPTVTCVVSLSLLLIPITLRMTERICMPTWFIFLIFLALFLHCIGLVERYYDDIIWWDNLTHILSSMLVSAMAFIAIALIDWYVDEIYIPSKVMPFIILSLGCSFGVIWEILEWSSDSLMGTMMQYSLGDTMEDLLMDLLGAAAMGVAGWFYLQFKSPGVLAQELGLESLLKRLGSWWERRIRMIQ